MIIPPVASEERIVFIFYLATLYPLPLAMQQLPCYQPPNKYIQPGLCSFSTIDLRFICFDMSKLFNKLSIDNLSQTFSAPQILLHCISHKVEIGIVH